jgi:peptide/nickel transport system substrate-binding protein
MPRYYAIFLNSITNSSLKDQDIRRALSLSIDRERITKEVLGDTKYTIQSPLFPKLFETGDNEFPLADYTFQNTTSTSSYEEQRQEAERLLSNKKKETIAINLTVPNIEFLERTAQLIQENWNSIGIQNVTINTLNPSELQDAIRPRNYEALLFGNVLENPIDLFPFFHSSQRFHPGLNLSIYQNENLDKVIEELRQSFDREKDPSRLDRIQSILKGDTPAIFLFSFPYLYLHTDRLGGITPHTLTSASDRFLGIEKWYISKARVLR